MWERTVAGDASPVNVAGQGSRRAEAMQQQRSLTRLSKYLERELRSETYERSPARKSLLVVPGARYFDSL